MKRISNQKPKTIFKFIHHCRFHRIFSVHFRYWRRYTFLSHLTTKSKISVRWIKKLVAATCGVYVFIHKLFCIYNCKCPCTRCSARHCVSWRPFLCIKNMYYHQQRCIYKISNPKDFTNSPPPTPDVICSEFSMRNA